MIMVAKNHRHRRKTQTAIFMIEYNKLMFLCFGKSLLHITFFKLWRITYNYYIQTISDDFETRLGNLALPEMNFKSFMFVTLSALSLKVNI